MTSVFSPHSFLDSGERSNFLQTRQHSHSEVNESQPHTCLFGAKPLTPGTFFRSTTETIGRRCFTSTQFSNLRTYLPYTFRITGSESTGRMHTCGMPWAGGDVHTTRRNRSGPVWCGRIPYPFQKAQVPNPLAHMGERPSSSKLYTCMN